MRRRLAACVVLGCVLAVGSGLLICRGAEPAGDPATFDHLLKLLSEHRHGRVAFTEVQQLSILNHPLHSSGELLYDAPDRLEKRTLEPRAEDLLLENGTLTIDRNHRRHSVALRDFPQALPLVESLRATLAGDRTALERYFAVHFLGDLEHWRLELTPAEATVGRTVQRILIAGEHDRIRTVQVDQRDGDSSTLTIGADLAP